MSNSSFDLISIGDCVIDACLQIHEESVHCHLNEKDCELCFRFGDKIPVSDCQFLLGGNGANCAVGFCRLGFKVGLFAEIGDDEFAQKITKTLDLEHVDTSNIIQTPGLPSTFSVIIHFQKERTIFSRHIYRKHDFNLDKAQTKWVYLTSLGEEWIEPYTKTLEYVEKHDCKLAFSPGSHQLEGDVSILQPFLKRTDVLFVNKEEAEKLKGIKSITSIKSIKGRNEEIKELLVQVQKMGPKVVVITDGLNGSYVQSELGEMYYCSIANSPIVGRTGAGDGYASGFLAATLLGRSIEESMKWGTANAGSVVEKIGAQAGLLSREEIQQKISKHPELKTEKID